jgi:aarF domain-containing kinase
MREFVRTLGILLTINFIQAQGAAVHLARLRRKGLEFTTRKDLGSSRQNQCFRNGLFDPIRQHQGLVLSLANFRQPPLLILTAALCVKTLTSEPVRRACYFWKEAGPIVAHYRWTQFILAATNADRAHRDAVYARLHQRYAQPTLEIALKLKGLYVKIGQVISARPDFMPVEYTTLLATLQDSIPPWSIDHVKDIVATSLKEQHGLEFDEVFEYMQEGALGSASIGQVHQATLVDKWVDSYGGDKHVAVKVMHPGSKRRFQHDFSVFRWLCRVALPGWKTLLHELEKQMMTEFDYYNEALSLQQVRANLATSKVFAKHVVIPEPHMELTTKHVLVMEMLYGRKLVETIHDRLAAALGSTEQAEALMAARKQEIMGTKGHEDFLMASTSTWTKLKLLALQRSISHYVDVLVDVHGRQIYVHGVWNGDPHPGNCLILEDGRLGLIDYGQTKRLDDHERLAFARVTVALGIGEDDCEIADAMRMSGFRTKDNSDDITMTKYARLFFDSDHAARQLGFPTPQQYFASLMAVNPLVDIPDPASKYRVQYTLCIILRTHRLRLSLKSSSQERVSFSEAWGARWVVHRYIQRIDGENMLRKLSTINRD